MCGKDWRKRLDFEPDDREWRMLGQVADGEPAEPDERLGNVVGARAVHFLCSRVGGPVQDRVVVTGARVRGRLDLSGLHLKHALSFRNCEFDDGVDLSEARCDDVIEFVGCTINGLAADNITACKDISAVDCQIDAASFANAHLERNLKLSRSRLKNRPGCAAFQGPDMVIEGGLFLDEVQVTGGVTLDSSHIGQDLDCRGGRFSNAPAPAVDATWVNVGRELRCDEGFRADGEVRLCWARAELLSFRNATLHNPNGLALRADSLRATTGCYLDQNFRATGTVRLVGAQIAGELSCSGGRFDGRGGMAIEAERLAAKDVYLDRGFEARGAVRLVGAILERQLTCTGGHFDNPSSSALDATGLLCRGSVYLDKDPDLEQGFTANGQVWLCGASVTEAVVCTGGLFNHEADIALDADGLTTAGNVMLNGGFRAVGGVRLARATVGRQLDCSGGVFQALGHAALDLTGLVGRGDVLLTNGFRAIGEVSLRDADITRDVDLSGGHLSEIGEKSLDAFGLRASGSLILLPAGAPAKVVDLRYANVARLKDSAASYPEDLVELEGFTYQTIENGLPYEERVKMLSRMRSYSRQPYQQLSKVYRAAGKEIEEREVAVAGLKQLRKRDKLPRHSKAWNFFMWFTVRYGYRLYQPFFIALPFVALNMLFFHAAEHNNLMEPVGARTATEPHANDTQCPENHPCFNPAAYSIQLLIPAVNLFQIDKWIPDASKDWGTPLLFWTWTMILLGWVLGFSLVAAINRCLRRE